MVRASKEYIEKQLNLNTFRLHDHFSFIGNDSIALVHKQKQNTAFQHKTHGMKTGIYTGEYIQTKTDIKT